MAVLAASVLVSGTASSAHAQSAPSLLDQQYDEAFKTMYKDPSDIQASLDFAKLAALAGDLEGAIGALERVLLYNPDLPQAQFELGNLYYRLGSYDAASGWYGKALAGDLAAEDRVIAQRDLAIIAEESRRSRFSGTLAFGIAHQSNANAGPLAAARLVGVNTQPAPGPKADTNIFASAALAHSFDLERQDGSVWETHATFYATRQFRLHTLDVSLVELDSGPRFFLRGLDEPQTSLRPYVIGTLFGLGNSLYFGGGGGGVSFATPLAERLSLETAGELRGFGFHNFASQPNATQQNGQQLLVRTTLDYVLGEHDGLSGQLAVADDRASKGFESYQLYEITAAYTHRFDPSWTWTGQPWTASLTASHAWRPYNRPNPLIDARIAQSDREWDLGAALQIGLSNRWFALAQVAQVWADSSLPEFRYRNTTLSLSVGYAF